MRGFWWTTLLQKTEKFTSCGARSNSFQQQCFSTRLHSNYVCYQIHLKVFILIAKCQKVKYDLKGKVVYCIWCTNIIGNPRLGRCDKRQIKHWEFKMNVCLLQSFGRKSFLSVIYLDIMGIKSVKQIEGHSWEKLSESV